MSFSGTASCLPHPPPYFTQKECGPGEFLDARWGPHGRLSQSQLDRFVQPNNEPLTHQPPGMKCSSAQPGCLGSSFSCSTALKRPQTINVGADTGKCKKQTIFPYFPNSDSLELLTLKADGAVGFLAAGLGRVWSIPQTMCSHGTVVVAAWFKFQGGFYSRPAILVTFTRVPQSSIFCRLHFNCMHPLCVLLLWSSAAATCGLTCAVFSMHICWVHFSLWNVPISCRDLALACR